MKIKTIKIHGQGNDYIFLDLEENQVHFSDINNLSIKLSDRHFGIGGDGLILIENINTGNAGILPATPTIDAGRMPAFPVSPHTARLRIFNADGSEATTCGTALRCAAFYLYQKHEKTKIDLHTLSGVKKCEIDPITKNVSVNMGKAILEKEMTIIIDELNIKGYYVNIGNPHFVIFEKELQVTSYKLQENKSPQSTETSFGTTKFFKTIENHKDFSNPPNVMFVNTGNDRLPQSASLSPPLPLTSRTEFGTTMGGADCKKDACVPSISIKIWERGSGFTLACGSGSCATAFVAYKKMKYSDKIKVYVPGGEVMVNILDDDTCILSGDVKIVFETTININ